MPADANPNGDIFGGWLLSWMDLAGGSVAAQVSKGRVVTVHIDGMSFLNPVHMGDEVSIYARLVGTGRSSMKIDIVAWRRSREAEESVKVTEGAFTYVAIDEQRRPRPVEGAI
ncbi:MAG: acyl-CoA thioesterase [Alphaproteobacteria bacterium]